MKAQYQNRKRRGVCVNCCGPLAGDGKVRCPACRLRHRGTSNRAKTGGVGFRINPVQYAELLDRQDGVCAVCRGAFASARGQYIDHDHVTGRVRGLLCLHCNTLLGYARDDAGVLEQAAAYLRRL